MRVLALSLLVLAGCAVTEQPRAPVNVVWNRVADVQAVCEEASGRRELFRILGCSKWTESGGQRTCTIYAPAPRDERDAQRFATLGHELMHCTDGNWHDKWGRMTDAKVREARREEAGSAAAGGTAAAASVKIEPATE